MTKPNITPKSSQFNQTDSTTSKTRTASAPDKWNPNKPFHVTQEEFWEHIHEIEKGSFTSLEEGFKEFEQWKVEFLKSRL